MDKNKQVNNKKDEKEEKKKPKVVTSSGEKLSFVVDGATLKCGCSDQQSQLRVISRNISILGKAQANIMDFKPNINIKPFGKCSSLQNPTVASATAANRGKLKKMPCNPAVTRAWINGKQDKKVAGHPALLNKSTNMCIYGGKISIANDGQPICTIKAAPPPLYKKDPNALPENKGNIIVDGVKYPIFVPPFEWGCNANFNTEGWRTVKVKDKIVSDVDVLGIISRMAFESLDDTSNMSKQDIQLFYTISLCMGYIQSALSSIVTSYLHVEIQQKGKDYRAVVQYGASNTILNERAGSTFNASDLNKPVSDTDKDMNSMIGMSYIKKWFGITDNKDYDIKITFDSKHGDEFYIGYLSNINNKIYITPKVYKGDSAELGHYAIALGITRINWQHDLDLRGYMQRSTVVPKNKLDTINRLLAPDIKFINQ